MTGGEDTFSWEDVTVQGVLLNSELSRLTLQDVDSFLLSEYETLPFKCKLDVPEFP